jgi:hypothetical protein
MELSHLLEKLGRTVFEAPFGGTSLKEDTAELAEIRIAVLDDVRSKIQLVAGRKMFPYNRVRICFRKGAEGKLALANGEFFARYFDGEIRSALSKAGCAFPEDLEVEIRAAESESGRVLWVEAESHSAPDLSQAHRRAKLVVLKGKANKSEFVLNKPRVNLGRTADTYRSEGISRRNDLVFAENDEVGRSVSREHAHILYDEKTGEYRLFNDRWYKPGERPGGNCHLYLIRDGMSQPVHRNPRGVRLQPGDEIHLGKAVLRFQMK